MTGAVTLTGAAVTLADTTATSIAGITATGALTLTSGGAITQSGAIDADSTTSVTAGANAITLTNAGNDFTGAVSLSNSGSNDVALTDANALDLGTVGVGQNLTVTTGGALTDSGAVTVAGLGTIVSTGFDVTLGDSTTANFGSLDFSGAAVSITEASAMEVAASEATGALTLVASGAVTQSGAIDADSTTSVTAGANAITLTNAGNDFTGAVSLSNSGSNDVALTDANALDLGTVGVGQNLTVTTGGALTDSGAVTVAGLGNDRIDWIRRDLGRLDDRELRKPGLLGSGGEHHRSERNGSGGFGSDRALTLVASGAVTQSGAIDADSTTSVTAGANAITLTNAGNDFTGAVSLSNSGSNDTFWSRIRMIWIWERFPWVKIWL